MIASIELFTAYSCYCLSTRLYIVLSCIYLSIYLSIYLHIYPSTCLSWRPSFSVIGYSCSLSIISVLFFPCLFLGSTGCGKSSLLENVLFRLKSRVRLFTSHVVNLNYYSDATSLLISLQSVLHKRTGSAYGPSGANKKLIYFIDGTYGNFQSS